ncbi:MAG: hypothetical protein J6J20_01935, partial [Muribaculaceae bacterium]|nr:hypothetical protein [Muribaculaceae bacterium]
MNDNRYLRRRAARALQDAPLRRVLFVCLGNICRSPAAQGVMQAVVDARGESAAWLIDSAG